MPNQVSDAKLAANRRNAQKSTGPRTAEGKARVARNAAKRALLADQSVVTEADAPRHPDQFDDLLADLNDQFDPQARLEQVLVERVALCFWRLRRAQHYETAAIHRAIESPPDEPDPADEHLAEIQDELDKAHMFRKQHAQNLRFLESLDPDDPDAVDRAAPMLDRIRRRYARDVDGLPDHHLRQVLIEKLPAYIQQEKQRIPTLKRELAQAREAAEHARHRRTLTAALPSTEEVLKLVRYENMLDRQLHRALNELRRLQQAVPLTKGDNRGSEPDPDVAPPLVGGAPSEPRASASGPARDHDPVPRAPASGPLSERRAEASGSAPDPLTSCLRASVASSLFSDQNKPNARPGAVKNPVCVKKTNPNQTQTKPHAGRPRPSATRTLMHRRWEGGLSGKRFARTAGCIGASFRRPDGGLLLGGGRVTVGTTRPTGLRGGSRFLTGAALEGLRLETRNWKLETGNEVLANLAMVR